MVDLFVLLFFNKIIGVFIMIKLFRDEVQTQLMGRETAVHNDDMAERDIVLDAKYKAASLIELSNITHELRGISKVLYAILLVLILTFIYNII